MQLTSRVYEFLGSLLTLLEIREVVVMIVAVMVITTPMQLLLCVLTRSSIVVNIFSFVNNLFPSLTKINIIPLARKNLVNTVC